MEKSDPRSEPSWRLPLFVFVIVLIGSTVYNVLGRDYSILRGLALGVVWAVPVSLGALSNSWFRRDEPIGQDDAKA